MASHIKREQWIEDGIVFVELILAAKDINDDARIRKYGDIKVNPSGIFNDPDDMSYPAFRVDAGSPIPFFTRGRIRATFVGDTLQPEDLQRRANLWGDKIMLDIQNALERLRILEDKATSDVTIRV